MDTGFYVRQCFKLCACVLVLAGNSLILVAIKRSKSLHQVTYYLLANLAVSDILFGVCIGLHAVSSFTESHAMSCIIVGLSNLSGGSCMSGVLFLALQSFLCLKFPLKFRMGFNNKTAVIMILGSWAFWACQGVSAYVHRISSSDNTNDSICEAVSSNNKNHPLMWVFTAVGDIHMVTLIVLQVSSLVMIHRRRKLLQAQVRSACREPSTIGESARHMKRLNKFGRTVEITTYVLVLFLVSWGPMLFSLSLFLVCGERCNFMDNHTWISNLTILNSLGNVFIYWKKSDEFRAAFSNICHCKQRIGVAEQNIYTRNPRTRNQGIGNQIQPMNKPCTGGNVRMKAAAGLVKALDEQSGYPKNPRTKNVIRPIDKPLTGLDVPKDAIDNPIKAFKNPLEATKDDPVKAMDDTEEDSNDLVEVINDPVKASDDPVKASDDPVKDFDYPVKVIEDTVKDVDVTVKALNHPVEAAVDDTVKAINDPVKAFDEAEKEVDDTIKEVNDPEKDVYDPEEEVAHTIKVIDDTVKAID